MSRNWYIQHNGRTIGPVTSAHLKQLAMAGKITQATRLRLGEQGQWVTASKVQGLFSSTELVPKKQETEPIRAISSNLPSVPPPATILIESLPEAPQHKQCPYCGELIAFSAIKCRHCNEFLDGRPRAPTPQPPHSTPQHIVNVTQVTNVSHSHQRWNPLVAAFLSLIIPGLGQVYKGQLLNGVVWFIVVMIGYAALILPGLALHVCCIAGAAMGNPYK